MVAPMFRLPISLLAWLLVGLMFVPLASAMKVSGTLEAAPTAVQGDAKVSGSLTALLQPLAPPQEVPPWDFAMVEGEALRIETDYAPAASIDPVYDQVVSPDTDVQTYERPFMASTAVRAGFRFDVVPTNDAQLLVTSPCTQIRPADGTALIREPKVQSDEERQDWRIASGGTTQWQDCSASTPTATITGDFVFSAWEVDFDMEADGERHRLQSGHGRSEYSPHPASDDYVREDRELYVYVTNGTMRLKLVPGTEYAVFLDDAFVDVRGSVYMEQASGSLRVGDDAVAVEDEAVSLHGDILLQSLEPNSWQIRGDVREAAVAGQPLATTAVEPPDASAWWAAAALVGVALAVAAVAWHGRPRRVYARVWSVDGIQVSRVPQTRREERGAGHWLLSYAASKADRHRSSMRHAKRACKLFAVPEALAQRGHARRRLGDSRGAIVDLGLAYRGLTAPGARADVCVEAAKALIEEDRSDEAVDWLKQAFQEDPLHVMRELRRSIFDVIRNDAWVKSVESGLTTLWGNDHAPDVA